MVSAAAALHAGSNVLSNAPHKRQGRGQIARSGLGICRWCRLYANRWPRPVRFMRMLASGDAAMALSASGYVSRSRPHAGPPRAPQKGKAGYPEVEIDAPGPPHRFEVDGVA